MKENRSNEYGACGYRKYEVLFWKLYQNQITLAGVSFIFPLNIKIMLYVKIVILKRDKLEFLCMQSYLKVWIFIII